MYTKAQAQIEIAKLVENFQASEARLQSEAEAQIENDYIRPLFRCLNWNTENTGLAVADYEFVLQRTDRRGLRPDYVLQLDGQHLLVIDAKQVKYSMHDPRWMNQVYAYAYSTQNLSPARKIDFAILTDFQEFVVLDCTLYAATPKAVGNFRVLDWHCDDYVKQCDTLWELFERDNVRQAARTRGTDAPTGLWARCLSPKKVKANRIPPDKAFLAEMDDDQTGWRVRLAKDMKKRNPQADGLLLTAAVQLLIDRLIFVKVLSDREIEDDYLSQLAKTVEQAGLAESDTGWFTACRAIFAQLNRFYNGSIFEPRPELEAVAVSNKVVRDILRALQPENSPYNFAVLPVEILGTIYERFLGRVVRTTEKQVKIEDKPEVRKAGGIYYTPQYIVDYIVQNTVGRLLAECRTPEDVARLKILDPACGSGSFLLGAYQALIDWHVRYYGDKERLTKRDRAAAYGDSDGRVRLTARLKRQILLNNLFGVDIDPQAVEVTRLSLSLKALEDTRREELYDERTLFKQTVLPDLSGNIKCGNSLIGPDYFAGRMFPDTDELRRVNPFDWQQAFPEIMAAGGFDAVVGNPPYGIVFTEGLKRYLEHRFPSFIRNNDNYVAFTERAVELLRPNGLFGFIVPNTFLIGPYFDSLKLGLLKTTAVLRIADFGVNQVFEQPNVFTALLFLRRKSGAGPVVADTTTEYALVSDVGTFPDALSYQPVHSAALASLQWIPMDTLAVRLLLGSPKLDDLAWIKDVGLNYWTQGRGKTRGGSIADRILYEGERQHSQDRPYLKGRDIARYSLTFGAHWLRHDFQARLDAEVDTFRFSPEFLERRKIVYRQTADRIIATLDQQNFLTDKTLHTIVLRREWEDKLDLRYILGLLNSRLMTYLYRTLAQEQGRTFAQVKIFRTKQLPIPGIGAPGPTDAARHDRMVQLVEAMLALHRHKAAARTQAEQDLYQRQIEATDREIDLLVYELYGLTADEIAVVEGRG